jgi:hypothetical protein
MKTIKIFGESKGIDCALLDTGRVRSNTCFDVRDYLVSISDEMFPDITVSRGDENRNKFYITDNETGTDYIAIVQ